MPKIVDHEQRRLQIIRATWRVIDSVGIANATTREIAKEAGYSPGVLAHYFKDKSDLMTQAMLAGHNEVAQRMAGSRLKGMAALRKYMLECLPLDKRRVLLARIEISFWGVAVGNDALIAMNTEEMNSGFRGTLETYLDEAAELGELADDIDRRRFIRELHVLMDGLSAQAAINANTATRAEQTAMLDRILDGVRR